MVALQECPSASRLDRVGSEFVLLGASRSHCGFVHLYARQELAAKPVELKEHVHGVMVVLRLDAQSVTIVAVHLAPGGDSAARRREQLRALVKAKPEPDGVLVLAGDMNVRDDEVEALRGSFSVEEALYHGWSWDPQKNRY